MKHAYRMNEEVLNITCKMKRITACYWSGSWEKKM